MPPDQITLDPTDPGSTPPTVAAASGLPPGDPGQYRFTVAPGVITNRVDPRLLSTVREATRYLPPGYSAEMTSGFRPGDPRFHGSGQALDIQLIDPGGHAVPNYQTGASFRTYENFAQTVHQLQPQTAPDAPPIRWGGYFPGPKGLYGAADLMHFDTGMNGEMGGGTWEHGLTASQRKAWPTAESIGLNDPANKGPSTLGFAPVSGNSAPALQAIQNATAPTPPPRPASFLTDFPVADAPQTSGVTAAAPPSFMRDFEIAPPAQKTPSAAAPASPVSPPAAAAPVFQKDFPVAPQGTPGELGLVWGADGAGRDPQTGELIMGGKPAWATPTSSPTVAATTSFLNGIPIVGPAILGGVQRGAAALSSYLHSGPYDQALSHVQSVTDASQSAYPKTALGGSIAGSVAGTIPAMLAAPEAFGAGAGGLLGRTLSSAGTGAAIGGADAGVRSDFDPRTMVSGAVFGGLAGAAAPAVGQGLGAAANWVSNLLSRTSPAARSVASTLSSIGMTPQDAQSVLTRLGPEATIADIDPALTVKAGGLASAGGAPTSILKKAFAARAANADAATSQLMDTHLGPAPDPEKVLADIQDQASKNAGPLYDAGRNGAPMDVSPVMNSVNSLLPNASGGIKSVLNSVKGFLTDDAATAKNPLKMTVLKSDPEGVLGARQAIDDMMYNRDTGEAKLGPNGMRVAGNLRGQLDQIVKSNPNFAQGDAIYSQAKGVQSAFQQGQDIFKTNVRPQDLQRTLADMQATDPAQVDALRSGARAAINDAMTMARRGEGPAAQGMFARATNNRANMDLLFPNGGAALDALHAEGVMRATEQSVIGNSKTAERTAAQQEFAPKQGNALSAAPAIIGEGLAGGPGAIGMTAAKAMWDKGASSLTESALNKLKLGMANALTATGPSQQAFLGQIGRAYHGAHVASALSQAANLSANLLTRTQLPALGRGALSQYDGGSALINYLSTR